MPIAKRKPSTQLKENEKKWTAQLMKAGWTALPSMLMEHQNELEIDPTEFNVLMQLASFWWYEHNLPHPAKETIAKRIGRSAETVQRTIRNLEGRGLIKRIERHDENRRQLPNFYDFSGLIEQLRPFAEEKIDSRKKEQNEKTTRRQSTRKVDKANQLHVVHPDE